MVADYRGSVDREGTVMINIDAAAERRHVEVLARIVLVAIVVLLAIAVGKVFWSWPAEPILQVLRFH
jgi:hypothetical protein